MYLTEIHGFSDVVNLCSKTDFDRGTDYEYFVLCFNMSLEENIEIKPIHF